MEKIIKILECIAHNDCEECKYCPFNTFYRGHREEAIKDVIEFIKEQQDEIARLKSDLNDSELIIYDLENHLAYSEAVVLKIKAEVIKEFAERIVEYIDVGHLRPATEICFSELDVQHIVEKIAKENVGKRLQKW